MMQPSQLLFSHLSFMNRIVFSCRKTQKADLTSQKINSMKKVVSSDSVIDATPQQRCPTRIWFPDTTYRQTLASRLILIATIKLLIMYEQIRNNFL